MEKQELPDALFVSDQVVDREVELGDGKKHKLYFKAISHVEFNKWVTALTSPDEDVRDRAHSRLVVASMVTADGKPALSLQTRNGTVFAVQTDPSKVVSATKGHEDVMIPEAASLRSSMAARW